MGGDGQARAESTTEFAHDHRANSQTVGLAEEELRTELEDPVEGLEAKRERFRALRRRAGGALLRFLDGLPGFIERHEYSCLTGFTAIYLAMTSAQTVLRPLWYDELYTLSLARLGTLGEVWHALRAGVDQTPPLFNLITRASTSLFGLSEIGLRAPAILGFWVFSLSIYVFVRRRASALYAAIAIAVPLVGFARYYAAEGRPYGLLLAFCGLSLLLWQSSTGDSGRAWHVLGLALSLVCAASVQYYGIVMVVPLAVAEAIRLWQRGYVDWPVAVALTAPVVALAIQRSFIDGSWVYTGGPAWHVPILPALKYSYQDLLLQPPGVFVILVAAFASTAALVGFPQEGHRSRWQMRSSEMAASGAALSLPVIAYMIATVTIGHYTERYAIAIFTGFPVIVAWLVVRLHRHWRPAAPVVLLVLIPSIFIAQARALYRSYQKRSMSEPTILAQLTRQDPGTIVIANPLRFLEDWHHSPPWLAERLCYIADPPLARVYQAADEDDMSLQLLSQRVSLCVKSLSEFVATHAHFLILGRPGDGWIVRKLLEEGATVQLVRVKDGYQLLRVQWNKDGE